MKTKDIFFAITAAILYSLSIPFSKLFLQYIGSTILAGMLYLGAGIGMLIIFIINKKDNLLTKEDLPYTIMMVLLDILAPILLLYGLSITNASGVSLLNNFEIAATALIALIIFKEKISIRIWIAVTLVIISSFLLSINDISNFSFNKGSLFVLAATVCWGLENNCTRKISNKNTFEIVMIKGIGSGLGSLLIGLLINEQINKPIILLYSIILGFLSYGLSLLFYIKAQNGLGAAKTSAFYAINPFIGSLLSVIIFNDKLYWNYFLALGIMIVGTIIIIIDTLKNNLEFKNNE